MLSEKYPLIFSFIILVFGIVTTCFIPLKQVFLLVTSDQIAGFLEGIVLQGSVGTFLVVLAFRLEYHQIIGYSDLKFRKKLWIYWPMVVLILLQASNLFDPKMNYDIAHPEKILLFVMAYLTTGLFEEAMMRGIILPSLLKKWGKSRKGIYGSVLVSGVLFGLIHIYSFSIGRLTFLSCMNQILYACFIGTFYAVCVLRTKSIWCAIVLHGLFDIVFSLDEITVGWKPVEQSFSASAFMGTMIFFLPIFLYALFMLRKVKPEIL